MHQMNINSGQVAYHKNALNNNDPHPTPKKKAVMNTIKKKLKVIKYENEAKALKIIIAKQNFI